MWQAMSLKPSRAMVNKADAEGVLSLSWKNMKRIHHWLMSECTFILINVLVVNILVDSFIKRNIGRNSFRSNHLMNMCHILSLEKFPELNKNAVQLHLSLLFSRVPRRPSCR